MSTFSSTGSSSDSASEAASDVNITCLEGLDTGAMLLAVNASTTASSIGFSPTVDGVELKNPKLATKLESQIEPIEFLLHEWKEFGITELSMDHYIQVGDSFWKPSGEGQKPS